MKVCKIISFRLWHQLTLKLTEFVKNDYFAQNGGLVEVTVKKTYSREKWCEQMWLFQLEIEGIILHLY